MEKIIEIQHLNKSFGNNEVLKDINFSVNKEKLFVLLAHLVLEIYSSSLC